MKTISCTHKAFDKLLNQKRLWCVFELSTAQKADECKVTIRMPPVERKLMFDALKKRQH